MLLSPTKLGFSPGYNWVKKTWKRCDWSNTGLLMAVGCKANYLNVIIRNNSTVEMKMTKRKKLLEIGEVSKPHTSNSSSGRGSRKDGSLFLSSFSSSALSSSSSSSFSSSTIPIRISEEIVDAIENNRPVVALESAIITHGMPFPHNIETTLHLQRIIRDQNVIPAVVGVIQGQLTVGLSNMEIETLGSSVIGQGNHSESTKGKSPVVKVSRRDLPFALSQKLNGGTTVSGTIIGAVKAKIPIFVTGGLGGVHRGAENTFDISADLKELGRSPIAVISAGIKSILDIGKTLEYLETEGVCVCVLKKNGKVNITTDPEKMKNRKSCGENAEKDSISSTSSINRIKFPSFFTAESPFPAPYVLHSEMEAANLLYSSLQFQLDSGILIAVPIPKEFSASGEKIEVALKIALEKAEKMKISGKDMTPFLLGEINALTGGESLEANKRLIENNARVGAEIAVQLAELRKNGATTGGNNNSNGNSGPSSSHHFSNSSNNRDHKGGSNASAKVSARTKFDSNETKIPQHYHSSFPRRRPNDEFHGITCTMKIQSHEQNEDLWNSSGYPSTRRFSSMTISSVDASSSSITTPFPFKKTVTIDSSSSAVPSTSLLCPQDDLESNSDVIRDERTRSRTTIGNGTGFCSGTITSSMTNNDNNSTANSDPCLSPLQTSDDSNNCDHHLLHQHHHHHHHHNRLLTKDDQVLKMPRVGYHSKISTAFHHHPGEETKNEPERKCSSREDEEKETYPNSRRFSSTAAPVVIGASNLDLILRIQEDPIVENWEQPTCEVKDGQNDYKLTEPLNFDE